MAITTFLFDLDGTLLPMDQDVIVKDFFTGIAGKVAPQGYDPMQLIDMIWHGSKTNEEAFWNYAVST